MYRTKDFDPLSYDIYHIGLSGGKDSAGALLWLRYKSGWPMSRVQVTTNETDNEDSLTYGFLALLAKKTGLPITVIQPELGFWDLVQKKKRFPSAKTRFCTQHLKVVPSMRYIEEQKKNGRILLLSGIRREEGKASNDRGDRLEYQYNDSYGCDEFLPVYEHTLADIWNLHRQFLELDDVIMLIEDDPDPHFDQPHPLSATLTIREYLIERMRRHGIPRNPLYDMGATRVGCFPCINSRKREIRALEIYRPGRVDFIETQEGNLGGANDEMYSSFFARNTVPLSHRSREIITATGQAMRVATIRDVVRWSRTAYGGRRYQFDFMAFQDDDSPEACDVRGMCE